METCFQESEDSQLLLAGPDFGQSSSLKSSPTAADSLLNAGREFPISEISEEQIFLFGEIELMSCPGDSRANRFPSPGSKEAETMTATSGRQCFLLSQRSGRFGLFVKTCLESSAWANSTEFVWIWSLSVTKCNRSLFQLTALEQSTSDTEFLLWPTPNATAFKGGRLRARIDSANPEKNNWQDFCSLVLGHRYPVPELTENVMGYTEGHTRLKETSPSETALCPSKPTRSSRRSRR
jgi:hypothetical protein